MRKKEDAVNIFFHMGILVFRVTRPRITTGKVKTKGAFFWNPLVAR
jgi:hypothetical protein